MPLPKALLALALACASLHAQQLPSALTVDPPHDKANPASLESFQIPSHGEQLNALMLTASGAGPHPFLVLLHGFPGNERNLDIAQSARRAGWNVLFFDYRGSWGTPGAFSFTHAIEDTESAIAFLRDPAKAARFHGDPKNTVLAGHSMGGMITTIVASRDPAIRAAGLISAANMAGRMLPAIHSGKPEQAVATYSARITQMGIYPLAGCTADSLTRELLANAAAWNIPGFAPKLSTRPLLVITSDDGLADASDALVAAARAAGDTHITTLHLATDHSYNDQRIALQASILNWLATLSH